MARLSRCLQGILLGVCIGIPPLGPVKAADSVAEFYKGKTITIVVGTEAGNPYDVNETASARSEAPN